MENNLAENIRSCRKRLGLTQEQLAERLGITLGTVSKWERGNSEPELSYIMDLAELFHESVDALIGFTMRGTDADEEADRIEAMCERLTAAESAERLPIDAIAEEYESALKKFPNHFRIVYGAAQAYQQSGIVYRRERELKKALELFRHAVDLLPGNRDDEVSETLLRNEIAVCYSALKDYKRAIEEYKKNNPTGRNDARIGLLYSQYEKKPEEGIVFTNRAFVGHIGDMVTTMAGYMSYYISTARYDRGIHAAGWTIRFLESLKPDPDRHAFTDKVVTLFYLDLAILQYIRGLPDASEESLRTAVRIARAFDSDPVYTLDNLMLSDSAEKTGIWVYDDTGPTAIEGLKSTIEELGSCVPEAFRKKFEREIEAAEQHGSEPRI